jgi:hypothetical protein
MASGYLTTAHQLEKIDVEFNRLNPNQHWAGFAIHAPRADKSPAASLWPFAPMFEIMRRPAASAEVDPQRHDLGVQLGVSRELFGKIWRLDPWLRYGAALAALLLILVVCYELRRHFDDVWTLRFGLRNIIVTASLGLLALWLPLLKYVRIEKAASSWIAKGLAATLGMLASHAHLILFDPRFLKRGSLARLRALKTVPPPPGMPAAHANSGADIGMEQEIVPAAASAGQR